MFPGLGSLAGGAAGGTSINPTATSNTDVRTGANTQNFGFGGINTGTQSALPPWAVPAGLVVVLILGGIYLWKRRP